MLNITEITWRRIFSLTLLVTLVCTFSPLLLAAWLLFHITTLVTVAVKVFRSSDRSAGWIDLMESDAFAPINRRVAVVLTSFLLSLPWSLGALIHPTQFLLAPGIPLPNGGTLQTLLSNPGGAGSPPWWVITPVPFFLLFSFLLRSMRRASLISASVLAVAILLNDFHIPGHGASEPVFVGTAFLIITVVLVPPMLVVIGNVVPNLRIRNLGLGHFAIAIATIVTILSTTVMAGWVFIGQSTSLVQSDQVDVVPAFVSALAQSPAKPKTLVLSSTSNSTTFFISRGNPLTLGDADVATATPPQIVNAVSELVAGSGLTSAKVMGSFGIQYLFLRAPVTQELARVIDGVGGFSRMSATQIGIVWRIIGSSPRVVLLNKYDRGWRLILNGINVPLEHADSGLPIFSLPSNGKVTVLFDGTAHRALISLELLTLLIAVVMALPSGRKRRQVPLEELV